jgi:hypothetical protein
MRLASSKPAQEGATRFPGAPFGAPMPAAAPNVVTDYDPYARLDPDFRFELD